MPEYSSKCLLLQEKRVQPVLWRGSDLGHRVIILIPHAKMVSARYHPPSTQLPLFPLFDRRQYLVQRTRAPGSHPLTLTRAAPLPACTQSCSGAEDPSNWGHPKKTPLCGALDDWLSMHGQKDDFFVPTGLNSPVDHSVNTDLRVPTNSPPPAAKRNSGSSATGAFRSIAAPAPAPASPRRRAHETDTMATEPRRKAKRARKSAVLVRTRPAPPPGGTAGEPVDAAWTSPDEEAAAAAGEGEGEGETGAMGGVDASTEALELLDPAEEKQLRKLLSEKQQALHECTIRTSNLPPAEKKRQRNRHASCVSRIKKKLALYNLQRDLKASLEHVRQLEDEVQGQRGTIGYFQQENARLTALLAEQWD